jgi:alkylation response protein AidB-like acyl-CoA dehydrogenase
MIAIDALLPPDVLAGSGDAAIVEDLLAGLRTGLCAYAGGAGRAAMDMAVAYAKDRVIFGRALGTFQAVAHRCADMLFDVEAGQLMTLETAWRIDAGRPAADYVASACAYVGAGSQRVLAHAHQIHGAIGFTFEHNLSLLSTAVKATAADLGREDVNQERVAAALGI